jgi:hypothetical protein
VRFSGFSLAHLVAQLFLPGDDAQILLVIGGAERGRAFEHHVLEQVRDAGDAGPLVRAARVGHPTAGDGRVIVSLHEQHTHAVGKLFFDDGNFLGQERAGSHPNHQRQKQYLLGWPETESTR